MIDCVLNAEDVSYTHSESNAEDPEDTHYRIEED